MATAVEFDFATKLERAIPIAEAAGACAEGRYCWLDVDFDRDPALAESALRALGVAGSVVESIQRGDDGERYDCHDECLHLGISAVASGGTRFKTTRVDLVLGARFLVTVRRGEVAFLDRVRSTYQRDFRDFARGPGFLLYECWDFLIDEYRKAARGFDDHIRDVQEQIFGEVDDAIFVRVATVTRDLLAFRKVVLASRGVLNELATRRSPFVAETTQPYLEKMVAALDRLGDDLAVEREILAETLNLYMGIVSHRTGRVLNRLTVVSLVFLPLSFLCGVYGMNFEQIPELKWRYGYIFFWGTAVLLVAAILTYTKRRRLW